MNTTAFVIVSWFSAVLVMALVATVVTGGEWHHRDWDFCQVEGA